MEVAWETPVLVAGPAFCGSATMRVCCMAVHRTTNNRMELSAAIEGLRALNRACRVTVLPGSEYLRRGITEFLPRWKENRWRNSAGKAVANQDLWEQLEELGQYHAVNWRHVSGHSGEPYQDRCDALAAAAAKKMRTSASLAGPGGL
jgi:ribonuclease HI